MDPFLTQRNFVKSKKSLVFQSLGLTDQGYRFSMQLDSNLEAVINKTIALHNRVYSPDVTAKLVSFSPTQITILFSGGFFYQCSTIEITDVLEKQFKALSSQLQIKV